jgi:hypothetical protein
LWLIGSELRFCTEGGAAANFADAFGSDEKRASRQRRSRSSCGVAEHLGSPPTGLPGDRLHEMLEEAVAVPSLYPHPHFVAFMALQSRQLE